MDIQKNTLEQIDSQLKSNMELIQQLEAENQYLQETIKSMTLVDAYGDMMNRMFAAIAGERD